MKPPFVRLLLTLAVLAAPAAGRARAEMIDFSYSWTAKPTIVQPDGGSVTGSVGVSPVIDGSDKAELGSKTATSIPAASVSTQSSAGTTPGSLPDSFSSPFNLKLHLTDTKSNTAGDLTFVGTISGTLTATLSKLTAEFKTDRTQELTLGGRVYSVTIHPELVALPIQGSPPALIDAEILVRNKSTGGGGGGGGGGIPGVPEPSSLVLGAMGLLGLGARRFLRARRNRAAA